MSRLISLYLTDIIESCVKVETYLAGLSFEEFQKDSRTADAVVRNLEIIGEAVKSLPEDIKQSEPNIEWQKISRFRDLIAHHYFDIDFERVWSVSTTKLGDLQIAVRALLQIVSEREASEIE